MDRLSKNCLTPNSVPWLKRTTLVSPCRPLVTPRTTWVRFTRHLLLSRPSAADADTFGSDSGPSAPLNSVGSAADDEGLPIVVPLKCKAVVNAWWAVTLPVEDDKPDAAEDAITSPASVSPSQLSPDLNLSAGYNSSAPTLPNGRDLSSLFFRNGAPADEASFSSRSMGEQHSPCGDSSTALFIQPASASATSDSMGHRRHLRYAIKGRSWTFTLLFVVALTTILI